MKLKYCVTLTVVTFLLVQSELMVIWLPLVSLIQNLSGGGSSKVDQVPVPEIWHLLISPAYVLGVVALGLVSVALTIRGLAREPGSKAGWIVLLVFAVITLLFAGSFAVAVPRFAMLYYDLGIK